MSKYFAATVLFILSSLILSGQESQIPGKPVAEIFTDFHVYLNDTSKTSGFGLNRAYLGYKFLPVGKFSGSIIINVGSPSDLSEDVKQRRYAYFREASFAWTSEKLFISFGMTTGRSVYFQQQFLKKRYVADTFTSVNGYGDLADLGIVADYKINDLITVDITFMNGEGFSSLHIDNSIKTSAGITITPTGNTVLRLYTDIDRPQGVWQHTIIGFMGFRNNLITSGIEAAYKSNLDLTEGHHAWGISGTAGITILPNTELFGRYDFATSVKPPSWEQGWNANKDGRLAIVGLQYTLNNYVRLALDYQGTYPGNRSIDPCHGIFLNGHFKF